MKKVKKPKPRNLMVVHMINRQGAGSHERSRKAQRQQERIKLIKEDWSKAGLFLFIGIDNSLRFRITV